MSIRLEMVSCAECYLSCRLHFLGCTLNGFDNVMIARASAEIALQCVANLGFRRAGIMLEKICCRHDHAWSAKPTLEAMFFLEALLQGVERSIGSHAFNRSNSGTICLHGKHGAGLYRSSVYVYGARSTLTGVTPNMGTS